MRFYTKICVKPVKFWLSKWTSLLLHSKLVQQNCLPFSKIFKRQCAFYWLSVYVLHTIFTWMVFHITSEVFMLLLYLPHSQILFVEKRRETMIYLRSFWRLFCNFFFSQDHKLYIVQELVGELAHDNNLAPFCL